MGTGAEPAKKDTSDVITGDSHAVQDSSVADTFDVPVPEPVLLLHTGTDTFVPTLAGDSMTLVGLFSEASAQRREFKGRTLGSWGLDRRRAAHDLANLWAAAVSHIQTDGFAVYVDPIAAKIDEYMPRFRGITNEDAFSGVLQLVQTAISGPNFVRLQKHRLEGVVADVLSSLRQMTINMSTYKSAHEILHKNGLLEKGVTLCERK